MQHGGLRVSVGGMLGLVACSAVNVWLFRYGWIAGLIGLNVTKHVAIAVICAAVGVNARAGGSGPVGGSP